ncbi:MAG: heterodisulfide reductase-related iron-sulfur binding cluster [Candidatus Zixiibacteriota bacterium]
MRDYAYYPGCSLEHTSSPYDMSVREVFKALDIGLREIEDWNCCSATMYMSVKKTVAQAISARNLAIAEKMGTDICAPCSSCYTILRKTNRELNWDPAKRDKINEACEPPTCRTTRPSRSATRWTFSFTILAWKLYGPESRNRWLACGWRRITAVKSCARWDFSMTKMIRSRWINSSLRWVQP